MELRKAKDAMERQEKIAAVARAAAVAVPKSVAVPPKAKAVEPVVVAKKDTPPPPPAATIAPEKKKKAAFSIFGAAKPPVFEKKGKTLLSLPHPPGAPFTERVHCLHRFDLC